MHLDSATAHIGAQDNPLHISLFPPHEKELLDMSFLLNSCLDIFEIRQKSKTIEQDLGLLQAVDERLATYGWLTNTGIKFTIVIDMAGRPPAPYDDDRRKAAPILGLRDSDLKPVGGDIKPIGERCCSLRLCFLPCLRYYADADAPSSLSRRFGLFRLHIFSSFRIHSIRQMIKRPWLLQIPRAAQPRLPPRNFSARCRESGRCGHQESLLFEMNPRTENLAAHLLLPDPSSPNQW
jgi:Sedlin, N-terminal conserved region